MTRENTNKFMKNSDKFGFVFEEEITEKRMENNPYIKKVLESKNILTNEEEIFEKAGFWNKYFGNNNGIYLEIGTGFGNFFSSETARNPDKNFIGVEIKYKRLWFTEQKTLGKASSLTPLLSKERGIKQFVLLKTKGQNIDKFLGKEEIERTYIFFPDPWGNKDRQKKHRLFSEKFIKDLYEKTKVGGKLIFKTDHGEYFDTTLELFEKIGLWKIVLKSYDYEKETDKFDSKDLTEFESIFREDRIKVNYVEFEK
ncbi:tRNA (guanosine(46)-N7)-methyltransferase TrmB [Candidatus Gracilibacteria bacterium]|nr:MAG: tRNA (guanosine(46)-N7)-methyltransferase TrmB [Candidatus Gracilibacteria bacterium]